MAVGIMATLPEAAGSLVNEPANTIGIVPLVVAIVAMVVQLTAVRRPGAERLASAALVTVVVIFVVVGGLFASSGLRGWYGGPSAVT